MCQITFWCPGFASDLLIIHRLTAMSYHDVEYRKRDACYCMRISTRPCSHITGNIWIYNIVKKRLYKILEGMKVWTVSVLLLILLFEIPMYEYEIINKLAGSKYYT